MNKLVIVVMAVLTTGCQKAKMQVVEAVENAATPPSTVTTPPTTCAPPPTVYLYECKDKHGNVVLQIYATSILKHKCSSSLKCTIKK